MFYMLDVSVRNHLRKRCRPLPRKPALSFLDLRYIYIYIYTYSYYPFQSPRYY